MVFVSELDVTNAKISPIGNAGFDIISLIFASIILITSSCLIATVRGISSRLKGGGASLTSYTAYALPKPMRVK